MKRFVLTLALQATLCLSANAACDRGVHTSAGAEDLTVVKAEFSVGTVEAQRTVTTLGSLSNKSAACLDTIVIEVQYFNDKGALVDTVTQQLYGVVAPPNQEVSFRVRDAAAKPKEAYAKQSVRVVPADVRSYRGRTQEAEQSTLMGILISWGPMLLLIAVWLFFMKRMKSKDSPQGKTLTLIEQQNAILESQSKFVLRIAESIESRAPKSDA